MNLHKNVPSCTIFYHKTKKCIMYQHYCNYHFNKSSYISKEISKFTILFHLSGKICSNTPFIVKGNFYIIFFIHK